MDELSPHKIYVSYSRKDQEFCDMLMSALIESGNEVWSAESLPDNSPLGNEMRIHLQKCIIFILLLSPPALESRKVREEMQEFYRLFREHDDMEQSRKIISVVLTKIKMKDLNIAYRDLKHIAAPKLRPFPPSEAIRRVLREVNPDIVAQKFIDMEAVGPTQPKISSGLQSQQGKMAIAVALVLIIVFSFVFLDLSTHKPRKSSASDLASTSHSNNVADTATLGNPTATAIFQSTSTAFAQKPYYARIPGPTCDKGGAVWSQEYASVLNCLPGALSITRGSIYFLGFKPQEGDNFVSFPRNYKLSIEYASSNSCPKIGVHLNYSSVSNLYIGYFITLCNNIWSISRVDSTIDKGTNLGVGSVTYGAAITIQIECRSDTIGLFINNSKIAFATDSTYTNTQAIELSGENSQISNFVFTPLSS